MSRHPERRLLIAVDVERYGRQDNLTQYQTQQRFQAVMEEAARQLGLDRVRWMTQQGGDGELAILPADAPETVIVARLAPTLDRLLRENNRHLVAHAQVRMRVALHAGLVHLDGANGFPGAAVVDVARLVNAPPLKHALRLFPSAAVAQIVSEQIYLDIVRHRYDGIRPERYAHVLVDLPEKGYTETAWLTVPDEEIGALSDLDGPGVAGAGGRGDRPARIAEPGPGAAESTAPDPAAGATAAAAPRAGSTFSFTNVTTNGPTVFGEHGTAHAPARAPGGPAPGPGGQTAGEQTAGGTRAGGAR